MKIQIFKTISDLPATWNSLCPEDFPFARLEFLQALETGHCIGPRTGWSPLVIAVTDDHALIGGMALFLKSNSYGEYIFDFAWAQAHDNSGYDYYPKLVSAIPFTPATGPKLLLSPTLSVARADKVRVMILEAVDALLQQAGASSFHALFIPPSEIPVFEKQNFFVRHSYQYHWRNAGYRTFADFLANLRSKRRREILRERSQVSAANVKLQRLTGSDLKAHHATWMYQFYLSTVEKMGGYPYLTETFFAQVFKTMKDHLLLVLAFDANENPVAGAINFFGAHTLYGRHWGCLDEYKALHFEVCYYQGIEFALEKGFDLFEAGAQGEHKFQRGFLPSLTYSAHKIVEPRLASAIQDFVRREKVQLQFLFEDYASHNPFQRLSANPEGTL